MISKSSEIYTSSLSQPHTPFFSDPAHSLGSVWTAQATSQVIALGGSRKGREGAGAAHSERVGKGAHFPL